MADSYERSSDEADIISDTNSFQSETEDDEEGINVTGETFNDMNVILQDILKQQTETNRRLDERNEANDHLRASMETLSTAMESLTRRLQRHENVQESSSIRKRKRKVPVDIKSTVRTLVKQKEEHDGNDVFVINERIDSPTNLVKIGNLAKEVYMAEKNKGNKVSFEDAKEAVKIHFRSIKKITNNPITPRKKRKMCMRSRRERLLERRRKEATEDEYQQFGSVLKMDYIYVRGCRCFGWRWLVSP